MEETNKKAFVHAVISDQTLLEMFHHYLLEQYIQDQSYLKANLLIHFVVVALEWILLFFVVHIILQEWDIME